MMAARNVLVTGANGYLGAAVSRAFVRDGWSVYGLVRRPEAAVRLTAEGVKPITWSLTEDLDTLQQSIAKFNIQSFNTIVGCTESLTGYEEHYNQVLRLFRHLATTSNANGVRPLVLWTTGSKDYGASLPEGHPDLKPLTEESPGATQGFPKERVEYSRRIFEPSNAELFDAAILRPTNMFGYSSSHYGLFFDWAKQVSQALANQEQSETWEIQLNPKNIMHSLHVDDSADAYVALASVPDRSQVAGEIFNIAHSQYETTEDTLDAIGKEYGFTVAFTDSENAKAHKKNAIALFAGMSQWLASDKIRRVTGWSEKRGLFSENMAKYRREYDEAVKDGHEHIAKVMYIRDNVFAKVLDHLEAFFPEEGDQKPQ
ncbi:NAD(P)-binding protein [Xylariaceae sp. FL1272]|nr:NAD(P)-binding protein [Xylariaceae sp. FL1272]